jgi:hypothetical protein
MLLYTDISQLALGKMVAFLLFGDAMQVLHKFSYDSRGVADVD